MKIVEEAQKPPEGTAAWDTDEFLDGAIHENYGASGGFDEWVRFHVTFYSEGTGSVVWVALCLYADGFNHLQRKACMLNVTIFCAGKSFLRGTVRLT